MYNDDISLATGGHSPLSSQSHFSPRLLTPDIDAEHQNHYRPPMTVHSDMDDPDTSHAHGLSFVKQPIAPVRAVSVKKGFAGPVRNASASSSRRTSSRGPAGLTDNEGLSDGALSVPGRAREGDVHRGSPTKNGQVSLLSAIMSSPEHGSVKGLGRPHTAPVSGPNALAGSGILSSNPSTALSSPTSTGAHGILRRTTSHHDASTDVDAPPANQPLGQDKPHGILRRGSMSGAECLGPAFAHTHSNNTGRSIGTSKLLESKLIQADEERRVKEGKIGWADDVFRPETAALVRAPSANSATGRPALKFAMAAKPVHAPSHGSTSASEAGDESRRSSSSRRAVSPFTKDNSARERLESDRPAPPRSEEDEDEEEAEEEDEDEDEEEESPPAHLPGYIPHPTPGLHVRPALAPLEYESDGSSDAGYEEDEEDGMFSEEDETTGIDLDRIRPSTGKFPFARSTNYWNRRESRENTSPGTSPPPAPAPAFILPPNRRGRGHIRVADQHQPTSGKEGACTRHCSPPPKSRSRSSNAGLQEEGGVDGEGLRVALHGNLREAPPAAASPSARRMKRPFDLPSGAGKKSKMAGSPMPPRISAGDDDEDEMEEEDDDVEEQDEGEEDEEEDEEEGEAAHGRGRESERAAGAQSDHPAITSSAAASYRSGWRSDDAAFYGPKSRVSRAASRNVSESAQGAVPTPAVHTQQPVKHTGYDTQTSVFSETEDDVLRESGVEVDGDTGVRGFMRRASEHLPMFRRPSAASSMVYTQPAAPQMALGTTPKAREPSQYPPTRTPLSISTSAVASPIPPPQVALGTCQPMLDDTPAKAETVARAADGGLAHRLEQTLGTSQQLGVSMAAQRSSSASSRPSTASRDSVWHGDATGGTTSVRPGMLVTQSERPADDVSVPYPQPRAGSNRPSLSAQGAATITTPPTAVPTQPTQPVSALSRAPSQSNGKVTFAPPPVRAVSSAMGLEIVEEAKRRRETRASASTQQREDGSIGRVPSINKTKTAPIRCPKLVQTEDLGWTEGALLNIRKNVGKGE